MARFVGKTEDGRIGLVLTAKEATLLVTLLNHINTKDNLGHGTVDYGLYNAFVIADVKVDESIFHGGHSFPIAVLKREFGVIEPEDEE